MPKADALDRTNATTARLPSPRVRRLPANLQQSRDALLAYFRPVFFRHGLTDPQWRVLRALSSVETLTPTETARRTFLLKSSLSRIIKDLTDRGLIRVADDRADGRQSRLSLAEPGRALIAAIEPDLVDVHRRIEAVFGLERLHLLSALLEDFSAELEAALVEPSTDQNP